MGTLTDAIADAVANASLGAPAARKSGRDSRWPYVPVITHGERQSQVLGLAYATRDEAVAAAERRIERERASLARKLADPRYRALREQYGLPRDLTSEGEQR